jgi:hypothetical protein
MALAGAVVLLWPNAPQAAAASGSFTYVDAAGVSKTSANPPDDYCIKLSGSGQIANNTDVPVGFYQTTDCKQRVAVVAKGDSGSVPQYASVMFSQDNKPQPKRKPVQHRDPEPKQSRSGGSGVLGGLLGG